jgi:hypothetical protein
MVAGPSHPTKEMSLQMCLPTKTEQTDLPGTPARSMLGIGAVISLACLAGPALADAIGAAGLGVLVGAGGAIFTLALCAAVPAAVVAPRHRTRGEVAGAGESGRG